MLPAVCAGVLLFARAAAADYIAYSLGKDGKSPLPERVEDVETKHLLNIEWGEYNGRKARLGVLPVDNNSTAGSFTVTSSMGRVDDSSSSTGVPVNGIEAIVINSLAQCSKAAEGSVVQANGSQIYVNLGQDAVNVGERLRVMRMGEELIDPETGISLGGAMTSLGEIEVAQVQEKFSIARPVSLNGTPERGDRVVATSVAAPLEFADNWRPPR